MSNSKRINFLDIFLPKCRQVTYGHYCFLSTRTYTKYNVVLCIGEKKYCFIRKDIIIFNILLKPVLSNIMKYSGVYVSDRLFFFSKKMVNFVSVYSLCHLAYFIIVLTIIYYKLLFEFSNIIIYIARGTSFNSNILRVYRPIYCSSATIYRYTLKLSEQ